MKERTICRGDLFYYDFGNRTGSVQSGERPVLVIQADDYNKNAPTIIVAAVTSVIKKRYLPSHIQLGEDFGLKKPSMVLMEQVQTVNKEDLKDYIDNPNYIVRRLDPFAKEKDRCDKCDKSGWDYVVTERYSVRKGKSGSYE